MSKNPLNDMAGRFEVYQSKDPTPNADFAQEVLPSFKKALQARRSIRVYDSQPIAEAEMMDCLKDATLAPSSSNLQPYQLLWIRNRDFKTSIAVACLGQPAATTSGEIVVVVARRDLWDSNRKKLLEIMTNNGSKALPKPVDAYYNKIIPKIMKDDPFGLFNLMRRISFTIAGLKRSIVRAPVNRGDHRVWAHTQAALAAQTLMLSLAAHGYDSCPMGGYDEKRVRKILQLPKGAEVNMIISAGRRKPEGLYGPRVRLHDNDLIQTI